MTLAATGHRLGPKLGGYDAKVKDRLYRLARDVMRELEPGKGIVGMALGWDMACGWALVDLGIPFIAVPFPAQAAGWPSDSRKEWSQLLLRAARIEWITAAPEGTGDIGKQIATLAGLNITTGLHKRSRWIVDQLGKDDCLLALWNGEPGGGTWRTIEHTNRKGGVTVVNVWELWAGGWGERSVGT